MRQRSPIFTIFLLIALFQLFAGGDRLRAFFNNPMGFIFLILAILIALVIHEFCHAITADWLGDPSPRLEGRVSLNPLRHLDPLGTLLIIVAGFGWGKPVGFDPYNLKDPVKDGALIGAAGPLSNILLATICALAIRFIPISSANSLLVTFFAFLYILFNVNLSLAVFNLLPIYPLDGHHILRVFFPASLRHAYDAFNQKFGMIVAFLLILPIFGPAPISYLMTPALSFLQKLLLGS